MPCWADKQWDRSQILIPLGPALAPPAQAQLPAHPEAEGGAQPLDILSRLGILDAPHAPDPPHPRFRGRHVR